MILYKLSDGGAFITDETNRVVAVKPVNRKAFQRQVSESERMYIAGSVPTERRENWGSPDDVFKRAEKNEHLVLVLYGKKITTSRGTVEYINRRCKAFSR